jgi:hypothetical protein
MNAKKLAAKILGTASGKITVRIIFKGDAPRLAAAGA